MPVPHQSVIFYKPDALPVTPPTTNSVKALKAITATLIVMQSNNLFETGIFLCWHDNLMQVPYADTESTHIRLCGQIYWQ